MDLSMDIHIHGNPDNDPSRSPKVVDFGTNRMRVGDILLVLNSNLGLILPLEILQLLFAESTIFTIRFRRKRALYDNKNSHSPTLSIHCLVKFEDSKMLAI